MKISKIALFTMSLLLLTACTPTVTYSSTYKEDLKKLVDGPWISKSEVTHYDISCIETRTDSNKYVYTVKISYSTEELSNFKAIPLPEENMSNYDSCNLPCIGYISPMNLVAFREENDKSNYSQYKMQIEKVFKQNTIYVSVSYGNYQDLIKF